MSVIETATVPLAQQQGVMPSTRKIVKECSHERN